MGIFWDLIQQSQISEQKSRTASVEERLAWVETELSRTQQTMQLLLQRLETHLGEDIDRDGSVGGA